LYGGFAACGNPPNGRLKTHRISGDTRTITYDAASRITNTADTNPIYNRSFDYDVNNRLTNQSDNTSFRIWSYDANSNRTQHESGSGSYAYTISGNSNRLQTVSGPIAKNYTYDAAGNPLTDGQTTFTWDVGGKLATTLRGGKTHTYKYNALDQRISKSGPLSIRYFFFFDANGQLVGEYKDNVSTNTPTNDWLVLQETVWLENIPVAVIKKPTATSAIQTYYIHADHLNTPRVIVNTSNTVLWRWDNVHAFGANIPLEDPDGNGQLFEYNPRFPGQYFDKETNLHYNYFRYYEPETGRYISPDPIGLAGGINIYGYAKQNPLSFVDPQGQSPFKLIKDLKLEGPKPSRKGDGTGSLCQIRYKNKPIFRIDYHPIDPTDRTPVPHYHYAPHMETHREFPDFIRAPIENLIIRILK